MFKVINPLVQLGKILLTLLICWYSFACSNVIKKPKPEPVEIPSFAAFKQSATAIRHGSFKPLNPLAPLTAEYRLSGSGAKEVITRNSAGLIRHDYKIGPTEDTVSVIYDFTHRKKWKLKGNRPPIAELIQEKSEDKEILGLVNPLPPEYATVFESKSWTNLLGWIEIDSHGSEHRILVDRISGLKLLDDNTHGDYGLTLHCIKKNIGEPDKSLFIN